MQTGIFAVPRICGRKVLGKLIFLVLVIVVVWAAFKSYRNFSARAKPPPEAAPEDMVRCAHCGVHLPRSESHASNEKFFCSEEHLRLYR
jgi:uncharacterized protein